MKCSAVILVLIFVFEIPIYLAKNNNKNPVVETIVDIKDFKKILRTKTNVLVCFTSSVKKFPQIAKTLKEAGDIIKGQGTILTVDCSGEAKKLCKKLKIIPETYVLKHYKDGEFSKDYDRKETVTSIVNFMRDPTGDIPWEEDTTSGSVVHIPDAVSLAKFIKKEPKPLLVMFYAPWCGFCKTLKPEYAEAANELQGHSVLAAIDVNRPENAVIRTQYNITGFPTLLYYQNGVMKYQYEGDNNKNAIVTFMRNPHAPPVKLKDPEWSDVDSEVVHLSTTSFDPVIKEEASVLIMFYAPWCGHCKKMKPEYEKAAAELKNERIPGMLAAIDATKEQNVASRFSVKGYPTLKYFSYGEHKFDVNVREAQKIVDFMKNPKQPAPPPPPEKPWSEENSSVVHLTEENFKPFLKKKKHVLVMFYAPWCGHCKKTKPEFMKAAEAFESDPKVEFAAVDCTTQNEVCSTNAIEGYPTIVYFSYYSKDKKIYNGGRTAQDFISYMKNPEKVIAPPAATAARGTQKPDWALDPVIVNLNESNFMKTLSPKECVLVMFYAPWCTHCKNFKAQYVKLGKDIEQEGYGCILGAVDSVKNSDLADEHNVSGFPTLKLFNKGKFVADYDGRRTVAEIKEFLKKMSSKKRKDEL